MIFLRIIFQKNKMSLRNKLASLSEYDENSLKIVEFLAEVCPNFIDVVNTCIYSRENQLEYFEELENSDFYEIYMLVFNRIITIFKKYLDVEIQHENYYFELRYHHNDEEFENVFDKILLDNNINRHDKYGTDLKTSIQEDRKNKSKRECAYFNIISKNVETKDMSLLFNEMTKQINIFLGKFSKPMTIWFHIEDETCVRIDVEKKLTRKN